MQQSSAKDRYGIIWMAGGDSIKPVLRLDNVARNAMGFKTFIICEDQEPSFPGGTQPDNLRYLPIQKTLLNLRALELESPKDPAVKWLIEMPGRAYDHTEAVVRLRLMAHDTFIRLYIEALDYLKVRVNTIHVVLAFVLSAPTGLGVLHGQLSSLKMGQPHVLDSLNLHRELIWYHVLGIIPRDPSVDGGSSNRAQLVAGIHYCGHIYSGPGTDTILKPNFVHLYNEARFFGDGFNVNDVLLAKHFMDEIVNNRAQLDAADWEKAGAIPI